MIAFLALAALLGQDSADTRLKAGLAKAAQGDWKGALVEYDAALKLDPQHRQGHQLRAQARFQTGDVDGAGSDYTRLNELDPKAGLGYVGRAFLRNQKKDYDGALQELAQEFERRPASIEGLKQRVTALKGKGDSKGALADLSRLVELQPDDAQSFRNRGRYRLQLKDLDGALADFDEVVELSGDPTSYHERGAVRHDRGDFAGASKDYGEAIGLREENLETGSPLANLWYLRANSEFRMSVFELAESDLGHALRYAPAYRQAFLLRAHARVRLGKAEEALADFDAAVKLDPKDAEAPLSRAHVLAALGRAQEARRDFAAVRSLGPDPYALLFLWILRSAAGERAAATADLKKSPEWTKAEPWPRKLLGFFHGDVSEADLLAAAKEGEPAQVKERTCEATYYAAAVRRIGGDLPGARALLQACVATGVVDFFEYAHAFDELQRDALGGRLGRQRPYSATLRAPFSMVEGDLRVRAVLPGGPLDAVGLKVGDLIHTLDGKHAERARLAELLISIQPGRKIAVAYYRGVQAVKVEVVAGP